MQILRNLGQHLGLDSTSIDLDSFGFGPVGVNEPPQRMAGDSHESGRILIRGGFQSIRPIDW